MAGISPNHYLLSTPWVRIYFSFPLFIPEAINLKEIGPRVEVRRNRLPECKQQTLVPSHDHANFSSKIVKFSQTDFFIEKFTPIFQAARLSYFNLNTFPTPMKEIEKNSFNMFRNLIGFFHFLSRRLEFVNWKIAFLHFIIYWISWTLHLISRNVNGTIVLNSSDNKCLKSLFPSALTKKKTSVEPAKTTRTRCVIILLLKINSAEFRFSDASPRL